MPCRIINPFFCCGFLQRKTNCCLCSKPNLTWQENESMTHIAVCYDCQTYSMRRISMGLTSVLTEYEIISISRLYKTMVDIFFEIDSCEARIILDELKYLHMRTLFDIKQPDDAYYNTMDSLSAYVESLRNSRGVGYTKAANLDDLIVYDKAISVNIELHEFAIQIMMIAFSL